MKELLTFLTALLVLAIVQSVANAAVVALIGLTLMSGVVHPARTLGTIATLAALALAFQRPGTCVAIVAGFTLFLIAGNCWRAQRNDCKERKQAPTTTAP